ncbi:MAG TPA: efflux RND transporter periplasmic adaptor subunit [Clostridia bacterium]
MSYKIISAGLILAMALSLSACGSKEASNAPEEVKKVKTYTVKSSSISVKNEFAGSIKAFEQANVISKTPGKVKEIFVKVGDKVKKGDILFTLDDVSLRSQLAQAEAGLASASVSLEKARGSGYSQSLLQSQTEFDQATTSYNDVKANYERIKALYDSGAVSKKEFDSIKTSLDQATERLNSAKENLDLYTKSSGPQNIEIAKAQYQQSVASVDLIKSQLNDLTVRADISGTITEKNINTGEGASSASPAFVISNTDDIKVDINIPENLLDKFQKGQKMDVNVQSITNPLKAEVDIVHPSIDSTTKNYKVELNLLDKPGGLKPGMLAKVNIEVEKKDNVLTLPNKAVVTENGVNYVYSVKNNKIVKIPSKVGLSNDTTCEIQEGIKAGDDIVVEGQSFLTEGQSVKISEKV